MHIMKCYLWNLTFENVKLWKNVKQFAMCYVLLVKTKLQRQMCPISMVKVLRSLTQYKQARQDLKKKKKSSAKIQQRKSTHEYYMMLHEVQFGLAPWKFGEKCKYISISNIVNLKNVTELYI